MEISSDAAMVQQTALGWPNPTKSVTTQIGFEDLAVLKNGGYQLCFAKKVVGTDTPYTVIWDAESQYLATNSFSWTPQFQLFGTNRFQPDVTVRVETNLSMVGLGEQCTLNEFGMVSPAMTGGPVDGITLINDYGPIHLGLTQLMTSISGQMISQPVYVCDQLGVTGSTVLTPADVLLVWFQQNVQSSMMFTGMPGMSVEVDLTNRNSATAIYQGGQWSVS